MSTHDDGVDAAPETDVDETAQTEPAVIAEAIGAEDGGTVAEDGDTLVEDGDTAAEDGDAVQSDAGTDESVEAEPAVDDSADEPDEVDAGTAADDAPAESTFVPTSDYQAPPIPKLGVSVAVLTLIAAVVGLVYYIAFAPVTAYSIDGSGPTQAELAERVGFIAPDLEAVVLDPEGSAQVQREMLAQILNALIVEDLLVERADEAGVEVTDEELDDNLTQIVQAEAGGDEAAFQELLAQQGLTLEGVRQLSLSNLLIPKLAEAAAGAIEISEEEIQAIYDQELENVQLSQIVVETEDEANDVIDRLDAGEPFEAVAAEVSIHESGAFGGAMGPFQPGFNPPEFDEAVLAAETGEIVGPIETELGFHVFTLVPPELEPYEDLRDDIEQFLMDQALSAPVNELIASLGEGVEIEVDPAYGTWVGVAGGGVMPPVAEAPEPVDPEAGADQE